MFQPTCVLPSSCRNTILLVLVIPVFCGCQVLQSRTIPHGNQHIAPELLSTGEPQIEVGEPRVVIDTLGKIVGIPSKLLLFNRRVDNHDISPQTLGTLADYLHTNHLPHVKVRANQYAPLKDFQRLRKNKTVGWPYRYTLGLASVARDAILPGRLFGGDHYNPYTQTIHLYSDLPSIALHEGAHAKDFTRRKYQGTYGLAYSVVPLWHETIASEDVFAYAEQQQNPELIAEANRILYPAYGTYVGNASGWLRASSGVTVVLRQRDCRTRQRTNAKPSKTRRVWSVGRATNCGKRSVDGGSGR